MDSIKSTSCFNFSSRFCFLLFPYFITLYNFSLLASLRPQCLKSFPLGYQDYWSALSVLRSSALHSHSFLSTQLLSLFCQTLKSQTTLFPKTQTCIWSLRFHLILSGLIFKFFLLLKNGSRFSDQSRVCCKLSSFCGIGRSLDKLNFSRHKGSNLELELGVNLINKDALLLERERNRLLQLWKSLTTCFKSCNDTTIALNL